MSRASPQDFFKDLAIHKVYASRLAGYATLSAPLSEYREGKASHSHWSPELNSDLAFRLSVDAQIDLRPCTRSVYASRGRVVVQLFYADFPGQFEYTVARYAVIWAASLFQQALEARQSPQIPLGV